MTDQSSSGQPSKIIVDSDWKAQAQAEKEKLEAELKKTEQQRGPAGAGGAAGDLPPADFNTLVSQLVTQAMLYLGAIPDPMSGQRIVHLDLARHHIDLLGVLEAKTKGNLDDQEQQILTQSIHELRMAYVDISKRVAAHLAAGGSGADRGGRDRAAGPSRPGSGAGGIIAPS